MFGPNPITDADLKIAVQSAIRMIFAKGKSKSNLQNGFAAACRNATHRISARSS
jgi:hypothetical protein